MRKRQRYSLPRGSPDPTHAHRLAICPTPREKTKASPAQGQGAFREKLGVGAGTAAAVYSAIMAVVQKFVQVERVGLKRSSGHGRRSHSLR
jgi:hypothetical protein